MTVKEKVREIAAKYFPVGSPHYTSEVAARVDCQNAINEMAEWKDKQFDSMIINFFHLIQDGIPFERAYKQVTGKNWQKIEENEKKNPAWLEFANKFEEGSDEESIVLKLIKKYSQMGYDICGSIPNELKEELKNVYGI